MRKLVTLILALVIAMGSLFIGYRCGMRHALEDSELWITEFSDPAEIHIHVDGEHYIHTAYIG